jgi:ABC-type amino acid transport system permease subunit
MGLAVAKGRGVAQKKYKKTESLERGRTALIVSALAVALLAGTLIYARRQLASGQQAHVSMNLIVANVVLPLFAAWLIWDWVRFRRRLAKRNSRSGRIDRKVVRRRR